ncbi:DUF2213 domain-containing protein [Methylobacterium sp. 285MFTsu5.1]|uniref:DUF2213 domain-containing protein n=1 Tax=Methylobacterium sp. 285MFTsu5.1 TaxID=1172187 RepID=UPI0003792E9D|nr:DUF2213 domain-containing protein [Methylobacterium sp. 285MFTsu5.1]
MHFSDSATIAGTRRMSDGYLVADVRTARVGLQTYSGHECGKPERASVTLYRPESEVFHVDSVSSYAHKPVTMGHPPGAVTSDNYRQYARGHIEGDVLRDGDFVRVPMMVADSEAIASITSGVREVSAGYTCDVEWTPGRTPQGQAYDGIMRRLRINHVAIVPRGRAGPECRFGDSALSPNGSTSMTNDAARMFADTYGPGAECLAGFSERVKAQYALADARSNEVFRVQDAADRLRSLARRAAMVASGQSRAIFGDSADNSFAVTSFLTRMADEAQGRAMALRVGQSSGSVERFDPRQNQRIADARAQGDEGRAAYEIHKARLSNAWQGGNR